MKTLALCFNIPGLYSGSWRDKDYGKRYPGSGWMKHLDVPVIRVISGKSALEHMSAMSLAPSEVIVIQEENNAEGQELVRLGADPRVLMCLESPIFASNFYDSIPNQFKHRLLFDGGTEHVYFPSFDDDDIKYPVPWNNRKFLCMVTSNKHYSMLPRTDSPSFDLAMKSQLHDYRYEAINYFLERKKDGPDPDFHLYGRGWFQSPIGECSDKLSTIKNYKFALCFENGSYPGYITEKIIDCFVTGVIPIYRGAPDIEDHIPSSLYIDSNNFQDFKQMEDHLHSIDGPHLFEMAEEAQDWLRKDPGRNYNNRVFAKRILELCE